MRKRIAVFANGWGCEYLREVITGAFEIAKKMDIDIFSFTNFSRASHSYTQNLGEMNLFKLPDLADFDGAILLANSFNLKEEETYVYEKVCQSGIPAISVEYELDGITSLNSDNYYGMHELADHIVSVHNARNIIYIGGPKDHYESMLRLSALQDVAKENGFEIKEENILYGDWAKASAVEALGAWQKAHEGFVDAIVCANDVMAMGAVDYCIDHGIKVPDDVIVTGYDCTHFAQIYNPIITSVSHEWFSMGQKAMEVLAEKMAGKQIDKIEMTKTRFVCGKSCGCDCYGLKSRSDKMGRNTYYQKMEGVEFDSHFRHMYHAFRKAEDRKSLNKCLTEFFSSENWLESENFTICLEDEFFNITKDSQNLILDNYSDEMNVVCALKDSKARDYEVLPTKQALFRVSTEQKEPQIYTIVSLSNEDKIYGFAILVRDLDILLENYLYSWGRHMSQDLEQVRSNITIAELTEKLTKLSVTDVLTGIYNRAGCERIAYPMIREQLERGNSGIVLIADVDRMKDINDYFGHANGDLALKTVADVLKKCVREDWIVSRFGGDEFFVGGMNYDGLDMEVLSQNIMDELHRQIEERQIKFDLSISIGYSILDPSGPRDVEKSLQEADRHMYFVKNVHHEEMDAKKS